MLRKIRIAVAAFFMISLTLLFLDYTGTLYPYLGWSAKIQFVPALLTANFAIVAILILTTLVLGRVYCSTICPFGIFQDVVSRIAGIGKKNRFFYRQPKRALISLRFAILVIFALAIAYNIVAITVLIEPYGAFGRITSQMLGPLYQYGNNILAGFAERSGSFAFYSVDIWLKSASALAVAALTFAIVGVFAAKSGRGYCNTLCPVGAFLSILVKFSLIKSPINKEKCTNCGICAKNCKAGCINSASKEIDYLRCVSCCNCLEICPQKAITFKLRNPFEAKTSISNSKLEPAKPTFESATRRSFISGITITALGFITHVAARKFDGGLTPLQNKLAPSRSNPIIPPGADNVRNFRKRCTGCLLCVSVCPNQVLRPSSKISEYLQPRLSYERGYCRPECVKCSEVCPSGAIRHITTAEKSATQIGYAVWNKELCIVNIDKVTCDLCARKCPTGAITLIHQSADDTISPKIPMIDTNRCIGCGACEQLCPSRPYSAIYVEGIDSHRTV